MVISLVEYTVEGVGATSGLETGTEAPADEGTETGTDAPADVGTETGTTDTGTEVVLTTVEEAGQFVTSGPQLVIVISWVE